MAGLAHGGPAAPAPTASSFTTEPQRAPTSNRGMWMGAALALFGVGALAAAVTLGQPSLLSGDGSTKASSADRSDDTSDDDAADDEKEQRTPDDEVAPKRDQEDAKPTRDEPEPSAVPADSGGLFVPDEPTPRPSPPPVPKTSPAPPAPAPSPSPAPKPSKPKWRPRKMTCAKFEKSKSCAACCLPGDKLMPYPSCECFFDGEKWDREHGVAP